MKKITILLLAFAIVSGNAKAQKKWRIGFTLSPVLSKSVLTDNYLAIHPEASTKMGLGVSSGVDFYRLYGEHLMFTTGIYYNLKNFQLYQPLSNGEYFDIQNKSSLLTIPLGLRYNFKIKQQSFFVNTGGEISWLFKSKAKMDGETLPIYYGGFETVYELFFGLGYMYKFKDKYTFFVNPEYSPKIFTDDYHTFRLNFGVILNY